MATTSPGLQKRYIDAAMKHAEIKWLDKCYVGDGGCWYAEVPPLRGVWATAYTKEDLDAELRNVIEYWIEVGRKLGHDIPEVDGIRILPLPLEDRWTPEQLAAIEEENRRLYDEEPDPSETDPARVR